MKFFFGFYFSRRRKKTKSTFFLRCVSQTKFYYKNTKFQQFALINDDAMLANIGLFVIASKSFCLSLGASNDA